MSEQEHELHIDNDFFFIQEQTTTALINPTSLEHISVQTNLFEQLKSEF